MFHAPIYTQFEPWMSFNMNDLDLHFTYCSNHNEWKLCQFLNVVNYMPIIIHVSQ